MRKFVLFLLAPALLAGCVMTRLNEGLQSLVGQDIHAAVNRIGYPDSEREMLGDKIYVWNTAHPVTLMLPTTTTTAGNVGGVPLYGSTTSQTPVSGVFHCTLQLVVDANNRIKSYQFNGNPGGCNQYANRLR